MSRARAVRMTGGGLLVLVCLSAAANAAGQSAAKPPASTTGQENQRPFGPLAPWREPGRPGSFELSVSGLLFGPGSLGSSQGLLTRNQTGDRGPGFEWFRTEGEFRPSAGVRAKVGYNLTRTFLVEGGFTYSPSSIRFRVSDDFEGAPGVTSSAQRLSEYFFDGTLVAHLPWLRFARGRGRTFVSGGAGYLRQLHEGNTLVQTGQVYHAGGGVKYMLRPRWTGLVRAFGIRAEGGLYFRAGAFSFDGEPTRSPAVSLGLVAAF